MEHNTPNTGTTRAHHSARPSGDPRYSTIQMGCMCLHTLRNFDTGRYSTNKCGYPHIRNQPKQSTTETQVTNDCNTYYIPGRQSPKTNDQHIIKHAI